MNHWKTVYRYFREQGVPDDVLATMCISQSEAEQIGRIIQKVRPRTILEIGTFLGLSTGVIALTRPVGSMLVCVDPDLPIASLSASIGYLEERTALSFVRTMLAYFHQERQVILLPGFFSHLSAWAQEQVVQYGGDPEQTTIIGNEIGHYMPYDLVFLDGDHHADAVYGDLSMLAPHLAPHGIIILHDVEWTWKEEVLAGIERFTKEHPDYSLKTDTRLGFLSRDQEKAWLVPHREPIRKRIRRKIMALTH